MHTLFRISAECGSRFDPLVYGDTYLFPACQYQCSTCDRTYEVYGKNAVFTHTCGWRINDFIGFGWGGCICVTPRVIKGLKKHGVRGWVAYPAMLNRVPWHLKLRLPKLYALASAQEHWGRLDIEASGLGGSEFCPECHKFTNGYREPDQMVLDDASFDWDQSDFFNFRPFGQVGLYVTRRVIEIARQEKWKGVYFRTIDIGPTKSRSIDPHSKDWPPDLLR